MPNKIITHSSYIISTLSKPLIIATVLLSLIQVIFLLLLLPNIVVYVGPTRPGPPTPRYPILAPVLGISGFLYGIIVISLAAQVGFELERGESSLYLSFPISRMSYILSWIVSSMAIPSLIFLLSLLIPLLILDPSMMLGISGVEVLLLLLQVLTSGFIVLLCSIIFRRRSIAFAVGLLEYLLLPWILLMVLSFLAYQIYRVSFPKESMIWWMAFLYPYNYFMIGQQVGVSWTKAVIANLPTLIFLVILVIVYTRFKFEVR